MWSQLRSQSSNIEQVIDSSRFVASKWKFLNAFVTECWEQASNDAAQLDKSDIDKNNPLYGMPLAVKDNFCTQGVKTTCASHMLDNFTPPYTATVVQRLLDQGMVMVGKTNMDSFAMGSGSLDGAYGPAKNPWTWMSNQSKPAAGSERIPLSHRQTLDGNQPGRVTTIDQARDNAPLDGGDFRLPGGSSGGSAAAVAAGIVYGAIGSDTGGSVRNPASYCGVVGLKPTYGLLSRHGLIPLVNNLDCPGVISQTVEQCVHMLNAVSGHDINDSTTYHSKPYKPICLSAEPSVEGLRVGIPKEYHAPYTDEDVIDTWSHIAQVLRDAGAIVEEVSLPHTQYATACYSVLNCVDVASNMARYDGIEYGHRADNDLSTESLYAQTRHEALTDVVRGRIFAGNYFLLRKNYERFCLKAAKVRRLIHDDFVSVFEKVDILLTPTTISQAQLHSEFHRLDNRTQCALQDCYTLPSNLAGVPAISVPIRLSKDSLPLSLQLITPHFCEQTLVNAARLVENYAKFPRLYTDITLSTDGGGS